MLLQTSVQRIRTGSSDMRICLLFILHFSYLENQFLPTNLGWIEVRVMIQVTIDVNAL